jgi:rubrerythrin
MVDDETPDPVPPELRTAHLELIWRCSRCGYQRPKSEPLPERCPECGAPRQDFYTVGED